MNIRLSDSKSPMTRAQRRVYDVLNEYIAQRGVQPTYEEIAEELGLSSIGTIHQHIASLERKGWLKRTGSDLRLSRVECPHCGGGIPAEDQA